MMRRSEPSRRFRCNNAFPSLARPSRQQMSAARNGWAISSRVKLRSGKSRLWRAACRWNDKSSRNGLAVARRQEESRMADIKIINPDALGKPLGQYSHLTRVKASEFVYIAGQVGVDRDGKVVGVDDFDAQCVQTFANIEAALKSVGAGWSNIVQFTTYMVHSQDIPKFMKYRLREFPKMFSNGAYPPNTLLMVDRLVQEALLVEVQAVAAL